jgi:hypothetical protein
MNSAPIKPLISTSDLDKIDVRIGTKWVAGSSCRWGPLTPPSTLRSSKNSPLARRQRAPLHATPSREPDIKPNPQKCGYPAPDRVTFLNGPNRDFPKWRRQTPSRDSEAGAFRENVADAPQLLDRVTEPSRSSTQHPDVKRRPVPVRPRAIAGGYPDDQGDHRHRRPARNVGA